MDMAPATALLVTLAGTVRTVCLMLVCGCVHVYRCVQLVVCCMSASGLNEKYVD